HPLPKPGVPALLPGERLPRPAQTEASSTSAPPASGPPASAPPASAPPKPRTDPIQSLEPSPREPSPREPSPSKISLDAPGLAPVGLGALPPKRAPVAPFGDGPPIEDLFGAPGSFLGHPAPVVSRSAPPARRDASPPPALVVSRSAPPARRDASPPPAPVVSRSVPPVDRSPAPASSPALPQRAEPPSLDSAPPRKRHAPISVEPIALPPSAPPPPQPLSERPAPFSARPTSQPGAPQDRGKVETIRRKSERPEWLETLDAGPFNAEIETESWVEDNQAYINEVRPGRFDGTPLALAAQPAMEAPAAISPVTGQRIQAEDCPKPQLDLAPVDDLEAAHHIDPALIPRKALRLAVRIPGPVVALPGKNPRQLCKRLALAVTEDEIVLKDTDNPKVPMIRLSRRSITLFEVVNDGAQLTFYMLDGRQMHLDLRPLKARAFKLSLRVIREITRIMEA
ncbi:hypothetical protein KKF91_18345, partial [Myxococcota bacterium]|nr:hypothetical protein [Myxococcota bacterium]